MSYTDDERRKIATLVSRARKDQGLDKEPAARAAKVNSITWKRVEDAEGVRDATLSKILQSLGLPAADEILTGESLQLSGQGSLTATATATGQPRQWATVADLAMRLATSLRGQAYLYEWTRERLPESEHAEHERVAAAAADPLITTAVEASEAMLDAAAAIRPDVTSTQEFARLTAAAKQLQEQEKSNVVDQTETAGTSGQAGQAKEEGSDEVQSPIGDDPLAFAPDEESGVNRDENSGEGA